SALDAKELDPQWLLARVIENLYIHHLYDSKVLDADRNPSEYAFQSEFATIIRNLLPLAYPLLQYKTLVEVKERDKEECSKKDCKQQLDLLIRNGSILTSYGFELVIAASTSEKEFDKHCEHAEEFRRLHDCQMFMVNLCPKVTLREYFGNRSYNLTLVNVVIDPDEWKGTIKYAKKDEPVSINGSTWKVLFNSTEY
ncbi:3952_t:CDS:2, partial [Paraglomus brasilianum]